MSQRSIKGYTLMEIMVAIVVLGVLASMAIPRYNTTTESFRSKEGVHTLLTVFQAQLSGNIDVTEARIASYTLATLGVTVPTLDFFNTPVLNFNGSGTPPNVSINSTNYAVYANITRSTNAYTLYVQDTGRILCTPQAICQPMKYAPW